MPGYHYQRTAQNLIEAWLKEATPCSIISHATSREEQVYQTTLQDLPLAPRLPAPTLLVVGEVVRFTGDPRRRGSVWSVLEQSGELIAPVAPASLSMQGDQFSGTQEQSE